MFSDTDRIAGRSRYAGMTLIELMVALAIGSFLLIGAITVFMQGRTTFRVNESISRLQENARFVLDVFEPDVRMASYWGLTTRSNKIVGRATPQQAAAFAIANDCTTNWAVNLTAEVDGSNNSYPWAAGCAAFGTAETNSDTLTVHRVAEDAELVPQGGTLYVQSARFQDSQVFVGPGIPAGYLAATSQTHRLVVNGYYVSRNSSLDNGGNNVPSLRVKTLVGGAGGLQVIDQEVLPGVEDMQIQFGVDTDLLDTPNRGSINRYVNPGDPIITPTNAAFMPDAEILSVRVSLRLRAELPENGYTDATFNDSFRRVVVTKTIYLRNARPPL